ncbi:ABC transporter substrate-binding protein [Rhizobium sp. KVB221]|uniref:ABC transporter substrate-binding protein n=2 Tax=Rhizobium setariae TaxID=2801340 RepID=A0A936YTA8_9HYPH|nr:ABC transporter substrate-binding protein [Rhizobium setariae]
MTLWNSQSRRNFLKTASGITLSAAMAPYMIGSASAQETPQKGGTLKIGMRGGSTTDSLNPTTYSNAVPLLVGYSVMNGLIEIDEKGVPRPELFESWEIGDKAMEWVFNVRKGIVFHNGKTMTADDIIYSLSLHVGEDSKSAAATGLKHVKEITKLNENQIKITLTAADVDLHYALSDYHILVVPAGFTDWANPIGTGAFTVESFDPGVRCVLRNVGNYWKEGRGNVERVEITVVNDIVQRMNALISGQVDVINDVDKRTVSLLSAAPSLELVQAPGGWHTIMAMQTDVAPFNNPDFRLALKYACNREQILGALFNGFGRIGNDQPIPVSDPFYNTELVQRPYDLDKAKFHLKKAGLADTNIVLSASDAAYVGAVDMGVIFQDSASKAGINITAKKEPHDGFWSNVWLKAPFCTSYWAGRASATDMLASAYYSGASWNETHWKNDAFDKLLSDAKAEVDEAKRKTLIWEMQAMLSDQGGALIPVFSDWVDAHNIKVKGHTPHTQFDLNNGRLCEKVWLDA